MRCAPRAATRGWSLTDTANRLVALGAERGSPVATVRSLRSQLAAGRTATPLPEPGYRALLAELLGAVGLGAGHRPPPSAGRASAADRLRAALAEAAAIDRAASASGASSSSAPGWLDDARAARPPRRIVAGPRRPTGAPARRTRPSTGRGSRSPRSCSDAAALAGVTGARPARLDVSLAPPRPRPCAAQSPRRPAAAATAGLVDVLVEIDQAGSRWRFSPTRRPLAMACSRARIVAARWPPPRRWQMAAGPGPGRAAAVAASAAPPVVRSSNGYFVDGVYPASGGRDRRSAPLAGPCAGAARCRRRPGRTAPGHLGGPALRPPPRRGARRPRDRADRRREAQEAADRAREARDLALRIGASPHHLALCRVIAVHRRGGRLDSSAAA